MARVPAPVEVRTLLEELLGRSVEVTVSRPWAPMADERGSYALYVDDASVVRVLTVCDVGFSARAGAAIGLLPAGVAEEAVGSGQLPEAVRENLYEVLNIMAALQNADGAPHMRLEHVHHIGADVPAEVAACAGVLGQRLDLEVSIAGYGTGRLAIVGIG